VIPVWNSVAMAKGVELTPKKKNMIVALSKEGFRLSSREISARVGFHQCTVVRFLQRHAKTGKIDRIKGRGRKQATTTSADKMLMRMS